MLVTGNDILSYKGDAALGASGMGGYYGDPDTKQLNDAIENQVYLSYQKNKAIYDQKIKERDEAENELKAGNIKLDDVPPQYRDQLIGMRDKFKDVYLKNGGDLRSDPKVWQEFNEHLSDFQDATAKAKTKLIAYNAEKTAAATETNPLKKKQMLQNMEQNMKEDIFTPYKPYQQTLDWDPAKVDLKAPTLPSTPKRVGYYDVSQNITDLPKYREMYYQQWVNNKSGDTPWHMESFLDGFTGNDGVRPLAAVQENMELVNRKLAAINMQLGLSPADSRYLTPLKGTMLNGKLQLTDNTADAVYKIMLAKNFENSANKVLNMDYAKIDETGSKIALNRAKIGTERAKAGLANAKTRATDAKTAAVKEMVAPAQVYDELFKGKTWTAPTEKGNFVTRINARSMSEKLKKTLGIEPLNRSEGTYQLQATNIKDGGGNLLDEKFVEDAFQAAMKMGGSVKGIDGKDHKVSDIFEYMAALGVSDYEVDVWGRDDQGNITRSNRLSSWIKQRGDMKLTGNKALMQEESDVADDGTVATEEK